VNGVAPLQPFPYEEGGERTDDLDLACRILGANGWIDLEDGHHYAIHGESFAERQQTYRRREINSPWAEGSYPVNAVRENTTETLVVWVKGTSHYEWRVYLDRLTAALEQLSYRIMVRFGDMADYWDCFPADYSVQTQREFIHAKLGVVRAQVPRHPANQMVVAAGDEA
jgi:hypothetical protein